MTGLIEVDCVDCGAVVLAVEAHQDDARCAGCGRARWDANAFPVPSYPRCTPAARSAKPRAADAVPEVLPWLASCPYCEWSARVRDHHEVWLILKIHYDVTHAPDGWASGIRGGIRPRPAYNRSSSRSFTRLKNTPTAST